MDTPLNHMLDLFGLTDGQRQAASERAKNTIVTASAIKPFVDKWGVNYLVKVSRRVMKLKDRLSKKEGK